MSLNSDNSKTFSSDTNYVASQYYSEWATSTRLWLDLTRAKWTNLPGVSLHMESLSYENRLISQTFPHEFHVKPALLLDQFESQKKLFNSQTKKYICDNIHKLKIESRMVVIHMPSVPSDDYQYIYNGTCSGVFLEVAQIIHYKLRMVKFNLQNYLQITKYKADLLLLLNCIMSFFGKESILYIDSDLVPNTITTS